MRISRSKILPLAAVGLITAGGSAFTAANTNPITAAAGYQSKTSTGFTVGDVKYGLGNPATAGASGETLEKVTFSLTPENNLANAASQARVRLETGGRYHTCQRAEASAVAGTKTNWTCVIDPTLTVLQVTTLDVVAVSEAAAV